MKKSFEKWNEKMYRAHGNENRYTSGNPFIRFNTLTRLKSIVRNIGRGGDVLELGCGAGMILKNIKNYKSITGVDLSKTALVEAEENLKGMKNVKLLKGDVQKIDLKKRFDTIICAEVLEHLPKPGQVIENIIKHSKPGTKIIISVPYERNIDLVDGILKLFSRRKVKMDWHLHEFSLKLFKKIAKGRLSIKKVIRTPFPFFPFSYTIICRVAGNPKK